MSDPLDELAHWVLEWHGVNGTWPTVDELTMQSKAMGLDPRCFVCCEYGCPSPNAKCPQRCQRGDCRAVASEPGKWCNRCWWFYSDEPL